MPADQVVVAVRIFQGQLDAPLVRQVGHEPSVRRARRRHIGEDARRVGGVVDDPVRLPGAGAHLVHERRRPGHVVIPEQLRLRQQKQHVGQADQPQVVGRQVVGEAVRVERPVVLGRRMAGARPQHRLRRSGIGPYLVEDATVVLASRVHGRGRARIARFELACERDGDLDLPVAFAPRLRRAPAAGPVVAGRAHVDRPRVTGGAAEVGDAPRVDVVASGGLDLE